MRLGFLILAGGRSSRMGTDKAGQLWAGRRAVDRLAELSRAIGAEALMTAGPRDYGWPFAADEGDDGGPVAGLAAGGAALGRLGCTRILAVAVDAPTITPADLGPLIAAPSPGGAYADLNLPLAWDLSATPAGAGGGWSVRRFIDAAGLARLACPADAEPRLRGANTPAERAALLAGLSQTK
jgi:molybdopterin-guanine dinucleotide biosynthesis protein A